MKFITSSPPMINFEARKYRTTQNLHFQKSIVSPLSRPTVTKISKILIIYIYSLDVEARGVVAQQVRLDHGYALRNDFRRLLNFIAVSK